MSENGYVKLYKNEKGLWCADVHWNDGTVQKEQWRGWKSRQLLQEEVVMVTGLANMEIWDE